MNHTFPIVSLPSELKRRTASYLCPRDALHFSETCTNLHASLSLRLLRNSHVLFTQHTSTGHVRTGDQEIPLVRIPCLSRRVHSITVTFQWRDQGWGNRKGQVWIIGRNRSTPPDLNRRFHGGRIVCESDVAPHDMSVCRLTFATSPMDNEMYQFWFRVGSGGGHQLSMVDGRVHTVIFDDEQGNISRNYQILQKAGAIAVHPIAQRNATTTITQSNFYPELLLDVSRLLRAQIVQQAKQHSDALSPQNHSQHTNGTVNNKNGVEQFPMASFFQKFNIRITEGSLLAIEEIIQLDLEDQASIQDFGPVEEQPRNNDMNGAASLVMNAIGLQFGMALGGGRNPLDLFQEHDRLGNNQALLLRVDAGQFFQDIIDLASDSDGESVGNAALDAEDTEA